MRRPFAVVALCLAAAATPSARAQAERGGQQVAIAAVSQAMIAELESRSFGRARHLCDQLILWEPANPIHHYNLACIEANIGALRLPQAFAALEQAVRLGFRDADHMKADPDLRPLRGDPKFAELLTRAAANATANPTAPAAPVSDRPVAATAKPPLVLANGLPHGLLLAARRTTGAATPELSAWYFAEDGRVFRGVHHGVDAVDLSGHRGPRGAMRLVGPSLEITWGDSTRSAATLSRRDSSVEWNGWEFTRPTPLESSTLVSGVWLNSAPLPPPDQVAEVPREIALRSDGSASWSQGQDRSFAGRWELRGFALRLIEADGTVLQLLAFPLDTRPTARIFVGGEVFRRP